MHVVSFQELLHYDDAPVEGSEGEYVVDFVDDTITQDNIIGGKSCLHSDYRAYL